MRVRPIVEHTARHRWQTSFVARHHREEMQMRYVEVKEGRRLASDLVDSGHHGKDGRVSNGCGVDASLCQLASLLMAPIHGRPFCHHHLHTQPQLLCAVQQATTAF